MAIGKLLLCASLLAVPSVAYATYLWPLSL